jgi:phosphatidylserine/phosphatidylglycerophosphate/cardiolipin synthase-like enzyme
MGAVPLQSERLPRRLHLRAMLRDGHELFIGSQSLRHVELEGRREVGIIVRNRSVVTAFREVFDRDWAATESGKSEIAASRAEDERPALVGA